MFFRLTKRAKSILDHPETRPTLLQNETSDIDEWSADKLLPNVGTSGSPALAAFKGKLYCVHEGKGEDGWLWYTTFDGKDWSKDIYLPNNEKKVGTSGPHKRQGSRTFRGPHAALAAFKDKLYCIHEGQNKDGKLWYITFDGQNWSSDQPLPNNVGTSGPPGLAVFQGKLYCIHEEPAEQGKLRYTTFDGEKWSEDKDLRDIKTSGPPSLAEFNGKLYCFHQGAGENGELRYTITSDGVNWSEDKKVENVGMSYSPAVTAINNKLYCFHEGMQENGELWYITFDGKDWSGDKRVETISTSGPPGLALFDGKLYCIHEGAGEDGNLWVATLDIITLSEEKQLPNVGTSGSPALAAFKGKLYCVHEGKGEDGWLWLSTTADGTNWSGDRYLTDKNQNKIGTSPPHKRRLGQYFLHGPHAALVEFNGKLYCIHEGRGKNGKLQFTSTSDGTTWEPDRELSDGTNPIQTSGPPGLAVFNNKLYCIHEGAGEDGSLWYTTTSDGTSWTKDIQLKNVGTSGPPSLVEFKGKLYCFYQQPEEKKVLQYITYDGTSWSDEITLSQRISGSPALVVFNHKLYCFHEGEQQDGSLWFSTTFDGTTWSNDIQLKNVATSGPPGLAAFNGKLYCIHEGAGEDGTLNIVIVEPNNLNSDSDWIKARGANSYCYYAFNNSLTKGQRIATNKAITVDSGAPFLYAVLIKNDDSVDFPDGAMLTIQAPNGTVYDRESNQENLLAMMSGSSLRSLVVKDPIPGFYRITLTVPAGVEFYLEFATLPSKDVFDTITNTLEQPNLRSQESEQIPSQDVFDTINTTLSKADATPKGRLHLQKRDLVDKQVGMQTSGLLGLGAIFIVSKGGVGSTSITDYVEAAAGIIYTGSQLVNYFFTNNSKPTPIQFSTALDNAADAEDAREKLFEEQVYNQFQAQRQRLAANLNVTDNKQKKKDSGNLRVATWNIGNRFVLGGILIPNTSPTFRMALFALYGAAIEIDIIVFQEAPRPQPRQQQLSRIEQIAIQGITYNLLYLPREYPENTGRTNNNGRQKAYLVLFNPNTVQITSNPQINFFQQDHFVDPTTGYQCRPPAIFTFNVNPLNWKMHGSRLLGQNIRFSTWHNEVNRPPGLSPYLVYVFSYLVSSPALAWIIAGDFNWANVDRITNVDTQGRIERSQNIFPHFTGISGGTSRGPDGNKDHILTTFNCNEVTAGLTFESDSGHLALIADIS
jgi:BNR repeat-like domain